MAKVVIFNGINTGLGTLTVKAFRRETHASYADLTRDTQANGASETAAEETNRLGTYVATGITDGSAGDLTGPYLLQLYDSSPNWIASFWADMTGAGTTAAPIVAASSTVDAAQWIGRTPPTPAVAGVPKTDLTYILGTLLTETAGLLAGGFKKFFNVATPTGTVNSIPDAVAGASGGLVISGSNSGTTTLGALTVTGATTLTGAVTATHASNDVSGIDVKKIAGSAAAATAASTFWAGAILDGGTAQAGASTTITLRSGASSSDDFYTNAVVVIVGGTGVGQNRRITGYVGSSKVATISGDRNWVTAPDNTSVYQILGNIP